MGSRVEAEQAAGRGGVWGGGAADALLARISMPYSSRGRRSQQSLTSVFAFSHGSGFIYKSF